MTRRALPGQSFGALVTIALVVARAANVL